MKRFFLLLGVALLIWGSMPGCEKTKEVTGPSGSNDQDEQLLGADSLALARTFPPLLANGVDQITVHAVVVDELGRGVADVGVYFQTTHGSIEPFATTDAHGSARTTLTSLASEEDVRALVGASAVTDSTGSDPLPRSQTWISSRPLRREELDRLHASRADRAGGGYLTPMGGVVSDQGSVDMTGVTLSLDADPAEIPADGVSRSQIVATLMETTSRIPLARQEVRFGSTAGSIAGRLDTDAQGKATAELTAYPGDTTAHVTAFYGRTLSAETTVALSALTLFVSAADEFLLADGVSSTDVTARLATAQGNPVVGVEVVFATTSGVIDARATTDRRGLATATLVAAEAPGTATITASFHDVLAHSTNVEFAELPLTETILLTISPQLLPADGASQASLVATALDENSQPMPNGTPVDFSIADGNGQIVGPHSTTRDGMAEAVYVAGTAPGEILIRASSGDASIQVRLTLVPLAAGSMVLTSAEPQILADGLDECLITAVVRDIFGNPVEPGTQVSFTASEGLLEDITPTDETGTATVRLRAERYVTGLARVTARAGEQQRTVDVSFVSEAAAHIEAHSVTPPSIGVRGASDPETATIVFVVRDRHGIPVDLDHGVGVDFSIIPVDPGVDATVYPPSDSTNAKGMVAATVNSGVVAGVVEVYAGTGSLLAEPIRVAIHGGLPDPEFFSIAVERVNVSGRLHFGIENRVTAYVGDEHGNPVPDSTVVWFSASHGIIQGTGLVDDTGRASVIWVTAEDVPEDGFAGICAQTISQGGEHIWDCGQVVWSGRTHVEILEPDSLNVAVGELVHIRYRVADDLGHPLTGGTTITVTATAGELMGDTNVVLPDTQDPAYTEFEVYFSSNEDGPVMLTVSVISENGPGTATMLGIVY